LNMFPQGLESIMVALEPKPEVLDMRLEASAEENSEVAGMLRADSNEVQTLAQSLGAVSPQEAGKKVKREARQYISGVGKADLVGTYNLLGLLDLAGKAAGGASPGSAGQVESNLCYAARFDNGGIVVKLALPKQHLEEIYAASLTSQQQMSGQQQGKTGTGLSEMLALMGQASAGRESSEVLGGEEGVVFSQEGVLDKPTPTPKELIIKPLEGVGDVSFGMRGEQLEGLLGPADRIQGRGYRYERYGLNVLVSSRDGTVFAIMCGHRGIPDSPMVTNCICRTEKGITIGSSRQEVCSAYGEPSMVKGRGQLNTRSRGSRSRRSESSGGRVILTYSDIRARFVLVDDKVVFMMFGSSRR